MQRDEETLQKLREPGSLPVLRLFQWAEPTVSFGRLQSRETAESFARDVNADFVVRRPTGGGLVFHRGDVSFSLGWRRDFTGIPHRPREAYEWIHGFLAETLHRLGFSVSLFRGEDASAFACFSPNGGVSGDVFWNGKKVVGGALRVTSWGRLYQGDVRTEEMGIRPADFSERLNEVFSEMSRLCVVQNLPKGLNGVHSSWANPLAVQ